MANWFQNIGKSISKVCKNIGNTVNNVVKGVINSGKDIISGVTNLVTGNISGAVADVVDITENIASAFKNEKKVETITTKTATQVSPVESQSNWQIVYKNNTQELKGGLNG